jgi:hypothetical protein
MTHIQMKANDKNIGVYSIASDIDILPHIPHWEYHKN